MAKLTRPQHLQYLTFQCYTSVDYNSKFKDLTTGHKIDHKDKNNKADNEDNDADTDKEENEGADDDGQDSDSSKSSEYQENVVHEIPSWMHDDKIGEYSNLDNFIISKNQKKGKKIAIARSERRELRIQRRMEKEN